MRQPVLFVDDQPQILNGIKRMLRLKRDDWDVLCATSGQEALSMLESNKPGVIVTDMKMPHMDGADLLEEVRRRYPDMMRVVLSGYFEHEGFYRTAGSAHAYLMKPCDMNAIILTVERALNLKNFLNRPELLDCINNFTNKPSRPQIDDIIAHLLKKRATHIDFMASLSESGMDSDRVLEEFLMSIPKEKMGSSITLNSIGIDRIRAILTRIHVLDRYSEILAMNEELEDWGRKIARTAEALMLTKLNDTELLSDTYCAGLLAGLGIMVLWANEPGAYAEIEEKIHMTGMSFCDAEKEVFGVTHGEVSAYYLHHWGFSNAVVETCAFHHRPLLRREDQAIQPALMVHLAETLQTNNHGLGFDQESGSETDMDYLNEYKLMSELDGWRTIVQDNE